MTDAPKFTPDAHKMTIEEALANPVWRIVVGEGQAAARAGHSRRKAPRRSGGPGLDARDVWLAAYNVEVERLAAEGR
jgi:hypothetical protein